MSDYDNGFARAQREYDAQTPPENDTVECPECDGSGWLETKPQSDAQEKCEKCDGTGSVLKPKHDQEMLDNNDRDGDEA